jgi:hypothetical protein
MNGKGVGGEVENLPGFRYMVRVATAWNQLLLSQAAEYNRNWPTIKAGQFGPGTAMQIWARMVEQYYGVVAEAMRGPFSVDSPTFVHFDYDKKKKIPVLEQTIDLNCQYSADVPDVTDLVQLGGDVTVADACTVVAEPPNKIKITIDRDKLDKAAIGQYAAFVIDKGATGVTPLAIIGLRIT